MVTDGVVDGSDNCPGSNPHLDTFFLANLANFHVADILAVSTYIELNVTYHTH